MARIAVIVVIIIIAIIVNFVLKRIPNDSNIKDLYGNGVE